MLTDAEKQWLEDRHAIQFATGNFLHEPYLKNECDDYRDAADFEARVARELTEPNGDYMPFCMPEDCDFHDLKNCRACRLKFARLAAEAEMDAQSK